MGRKDVQPFRRVADDRVNSHYRFLTPYRPIPSRTVMTITSWAVTIPNNPKNLTAHTGIINRIKGFFLSQPTNSRLRWDQTAQRSSFYRFAARNCLPDTIDA